MMKLGPLSVLALLGWSTFASAGPWLREAGQTFLSLESSWASPKDDFGSSPDAYNSVYLERGIRPNLTFGLDAGIGNSGSYSALAFVKLPMWSTDGPYRYAYRFGLGAVGDETQRDLALMTGAHWGRGFETTWGGGWFSVDGQIHLIPSKDERIVKLDTTVGIKPIDGLKVIMQVQTGDYPNSDSYLRLAPSVTWEFAPGRHLQVGGQVGLVGDDRYGVKVGTWLEF